MTGSVKRPDFDIPHHRDKLVMAKGNKMKKFELYDLETDSNEANNIASQHPEKVSTMTRQLRAWQQSVENSLTSADYAN